MPYTQIVNIPTYGRLAGTALTGSYQTVITATQDCGIILCFNTCNQPIIVSLNNGTTDQFYLDGQGFVLDFRTNDLELGVPIVKVKHAGVVPTTGSISITLGQLS